MVELGASIKLTSSAVSVLSNMPFFVKVAKPLGDLVVLVEQVTKGQNSFPDKHERSV